MPVIRRLPLCHVAVRPTSVPTVGPTSVAGPGRLPAGRGVPRSTSGSPTRAIEPTGRRTVRAKVPGEQGEQRHRRWWRRVAWSRVVTLGQPGVPTRQASGRAGRGLPRAETLPSGAVPASPLSGAPPGPARPGGARASRAELGPPSGRERPAWSRATMADRQLPEIETPFLPETCYRDVLGIPARVRAALVIGRQLPVSRRSSSPVAACDLAVRDAVTRQEVALLIGFPGPVSVLPSHRKIIKTPANHRASEFMTNRPARSSTALRSDRGFILLMLSTAISALGSGMYLPAIQLLATEIAQHDRVVAGVRVAMTLPPVLFILLAGVAADRMRRRRLMILADAVRAAAVLAFALVVGAEVQSMWFVLLVVIVLGSSQTFFDSSAQALLPQLVPKGALVQANGWLTTALTLGFSFVGPALGGVLFSWNHSLPFFVNALTFVVSGLLILWIRSSTTRLDEPPDRRTPRSGVVADIRAGLAYTAGHPVLRSVTLLGITVSFSVGMVTGIFVLFATRHLALGPVGYGVLLVSESLGALLGSLVALRLRDRVGRRSVFRILPVVMALTYLLEISTRSVPFIFLIIVVGNAAFLVWVITSTSVRQEVGPPELLGRITSVYRLGTLAATGLGAIIGGLISESFGVRAPFLAAAMLLLAIPWFVPLRVPAAPPPGPGPSEQPLPEQSPGQLLYPGPPLSGPPVPEQSFPGQPPSKHGAEASRDMLPG
ncbi:MFS transporter [Actinoalloteichus sp. GBA129-24]|uniref:MFS transporter n=1 Tax=Actinoalloteichus sp. GBA129-24 TaxID=1612551 RepID=UPI0009FA7642|nr:MFS transporter [Actinoalloteichus sp. GBA129-24]